MPLKIQFKGTKKEQKFAEKLIHPYEEPETGSRNKFLDFLLLGEEEFNAMRKCSTVTGDVPVTAKFNKKGNKYESLSFRGKLYGELGTLSVIEIKPLDRELSFFGNSVLEKVEVYGSNSKSVLFSYGIRDGHLADGKMIVRLHYKPDSAR